MSAQERAPKLAGNGARKENINGNAHIVPLRPRLRRTNGIVGLYFAMPDAWRHARRDAMSRTMSVELMERITGETST